MEVSFIERIIEGSPVIVLVLLGWSWVMWQRLTEKYKVIMAMYETNVTTQRGIGISLTEMTLAIRELRSTIDRHDSSSADILSDKEHPTK